MEDVSGGREPRNKELQAANEALHAEVVDLRARLEELSRENRDLCARAKQRPVPAPDQSDAGPRVVGGLSATEEIRRQRELLERLMEAAPVVIAVTRGPDHRFEYVNPTFHRMVQTAGREVIGRPAADILPTTRGSGTLAIVDEVFRTGRPARLREHESKAVPGRLTYWNMDLLPLVGSEGRPDGLLVLGQDITEQVVARRQAEDKAREAQAAGEQAGRRAAELDTVLASMADGVVIYRPSGEISHMNAAARALLGFSAEMSGESYRTRAAALRPVDPDGRPIPFEELPGARALRGETVRNVLMGLPAGGGGSPAETRWILTGAAPVPSANGDLAGAVLTFSDVTERKELEAKMEATLVALRESSDELERRVQERTAELTQAYALVEQRVEERTRELTALLSIAHHLASELQLEPILRVLLDQLHQLLEYSGVTVFVIEGTQFRVLDYQGTLERETVVDLCFPMKEAYGLAEVVRKRQALVIPDIQADTELARGYRRSAHAVQKHLTAGARSWMAVPLVVRDRVIGVLRFDHGKPDYFGDHELEWGMALAQHVAVAIDNAWLYEQARELAVVEERQRLARELHDAVSQTLFSASLIADVLPRLWQQDATRVPGLLAELGELTRGARAELRMLLTELRPESLLQTELDVLLRQLAESAAARGRLKIAVQADGSLPPLPANVRVALYRIAQEALNNVVKHAAAQAVIVELHWSKSKGGALSVHLAISDDGLGFNPRSVPAERFGLRIMHERASEIGAELDIQSQAGQGTCLTVTWPGGGEG